MLYLKEANQSIEDFSVNTADYKIADAAVESITTHTKLNEVFVKSKNIKAKITLNFGKTAHCKVFIGDNVAGDISATFHGNHSILYIGNNCILNNLQIRSFQNHDFIAIGNGVTTTEKNVWISGNGAGSKTPAIIIGDDCMFAYDIVLRNSDAHPIYSLQTEQQINQPSGIIHIEPHVWIGEQVSILKSVTIGACSIIALGSIVTQSLPRFALAKGKPAVATIKTDIYWARGYDRGSRKKAKYWTNRYQNN